MKRTRILIPIPTYGFDPTEAAIPWKLLSNNHCEIVFVTPQGNKAKADIIMLTGERLGLWKPLLRARQDAVEAYFEMENSESFNNPLKYTDVYEKNFDAIFLPGGHVKGVKEYIGISRITTTCSRFF